jgi:hypothetical protein
MTKSGVEAVFSDTGPLRVITLRDIFRFARSADGDYATFFTVFGHSFRINYKKGVSDHAWGGTGK